MDLTGGGELGWRGGAALASVRIVLPWKHDVVVILVPSPWPYWGTRALSLGLAGWHRRWSHDIKAILKLQHDGLSVNVTSIF